MNGCVKNFRPEINIAAELGLHGMSSHLPFINDHSGAYGQFTTVRLDAPDEVTANGWTRVPGENFAPVCVLITDGKEGILATPVKKAKKGTGTGVDGTAQPKFPWAISIPDKFLTNDNSPLNAWVYDAKRHRFVQLREVVSENGLSSNWQRHPSSDVIGK